MLELVLTIPAMVQDVRSLRGGVTRQSSFSCFRVIFLIGTSKQSFRK